MTILITGAAGLNGTAAVHEFTRHGEPVRALVRNRARARELQALSTVELVEQFPGTDHAATLRYAVTYAHAAETAGIDGVWLAEHHLITYGVCRSAGALAGFLLGRTSRLRVGTAAAILSNRHPVALAEEAVLLDAVSGGRFDLGAYLDHLLAIHPIGRPERRALAQRLRPHLHPHPHHGHRTGRPGREPDAAAPAARDDSPDSRQTG